MKVTLNRQKLGLEDLEFGTNTVTQTRGGKPVTITQINASNLPFDETKSLQDVYSDMQPLLDNVASINAVANDVNNINIVADDIDTINVFTLDRTNILYGSGIPSSNINPITGTNAMYVDTNTNTSYICIDATKDANVWVINGSGQFADIGDIDGKSVPYVIGTTATNEIITVKSGQNSFAIDEITIADGTELIVEDNAIFKVL